MITKLKPRKHKRLPNETAGIKFSQRENQSIVYDIASDFQWKISATAVFVLYALLMVYNQKQLFQ